MKQLATTAEVIAALGGNIPVAELTGARPKTVSMWKTFGKFPWRTQMALSRALNARGMCAPESLWGMTTKRSRAAA